MAIYSTFFALSAAALTLAFPGWKPPLSQSESRVVSTLWGKTTIQTREPHFESFTGSLNSPKVTVGNGRYSDYLESRLPEVIVKAPHWTTKALTPVELDPLGILVDGKPALQEALFSPPSEGSVVYEVRKDVLRAIASSPDEFARQWAKEMSTPKYTRSQAGIRVAPDWKTEEALKIIRELVALLQTVHDDASVYLLLEP